MGNIKTKKKARGRQGKDHKARKMTSSGKLKKKRGDLSQVSQYNVGFDVKQKKGGKWVRASNVRKCKIHTVCNCVNRADPHSTKQIYNR